MGWPISRCLQLIRGGKIVGSSPAVLFQYCCVARESIPGTSLVFQYSAYRTLLYAYYLILVRTCIDMKGFRIIYSKHIRTKPVRKAWPRGHNTILQ